MNSISKLKKHDINITKKSFGERVVRDFKKNRVPYLLILPVLAFYIIFHYAPMYGVVIAFKNYSPGKGIIGSAWVGLDHFINFFKSVYFKRVLVNTLRISITNIIFGFSTPIILALLINELKSIRYSRVVQTITYMPHFISLVVVCGMLADFTSSNGIITQICMKFGMEGRNLLRVPNYFTTIYVASDVWQGVGWGSIIYLAALAGIDPSLHEAARIDGANRWRQVWAVDIPSILPTIITLLILRMGRVMSVGYEKIILLYNSLTMEKADVIASFVYRKGLLESNYGYSTAVGLFNSVINMLLVITANAISRKTNETSLW
ncbi:MAG: ABC transporter permease subunit [Firmicutes bacterium]|nr:ABC transporter permease subunit [Bacillota bacterium]